MYDEVKAILSKAKSIVFLGGAGVSTASKIPDFRSPQGIFEAERKYGVPYETLLSHTYFIHHPEEFFSFYWDKMVYPDAQPNAAHLALADYEKRGHRLTILTQNIDGLHQKAGSKKVVELHGSVSSYHCLDCNRHYALMDIVHHGIPHCQCGGILKPDVVLYEEPLDQEALLASVKALREADVLIVGGTSLNVYPAAGLIYEFQGRHTILINKEKTPLDSYFEYRIHDDIGAVLTEILK